MSYTLPIVPHATYSSALTQTVASTSTAYPVIFESADDERDIYHLSGTFTVQIPHAYKTGEDIKVHIHWTPDTMGSRDWGTK